MKAVVLALILCIPYGQASITQKKSDREQDGFLGPVKEVFVEWSPISGSYVPAGSRCRDRRDVYDKNGQLVTHSLYFGSCGSDETREDYTYSEDGSRIEKRKEIRGKNSPPPPPPPAFSRSNSKDNGEPKTVFKYDSSGRRIEETSILPSGTVAYRITYSYDSNDRLIEMDSYDDNGQISSRRVYGYDGPQRVPSSFAYVGRNGRVYEKTTYSDYEFNSYGDWVKRKETTEEAPSRRSVSLQFRKIDYYPTGK